MSVYRPRQVRQADGSRLQWFNCTMAAAAVALDRHTRGVKRSTGAKMRSCQSDQIGGTPLAAAKAAWYRCYREVLTVRLGISWNTFVSAINYGRGGELQLWYAYLPSAYRCQAGASFNHAVFVNEFDSSRENGLTYDPLCGSAKWIPVQYLKKAAGGLRTSRGAIGYGKVYAAFTRVTNPVASPTPPPVNTGTVSLKFGGVKITAHTYHAKVAAKQRRSPYIRSDNTIRTIAAGAVFIAYQKTTKGTNVGGSTTWYGNAIGTVWMHSSVLK